MSEVTLLVTSRPTLFSERNLTQMKTDCSNNSTFVSGCEERKPGSVTSVNAKEMASGSRLSLRTDHQEIEYLPVQSKPLMVCSFRPD